MKALIRLGKGKYYSSKVFAIINTKIGNEDKGRMASQYLVLNETGDELVLKYKYEQDTKYINLLVLLYDCDTSDMILDDYGLGRVKFITEEELLNTALNNKNDNNLLEKCKNYITKYEGDYIEIKNENDIENLMCVSGNFHDGYIKEIRNNPNGELVVLFDALWGCKIELVFSSDVIYHCGRSIENGDDVYWYGSSIIFDKGLLLFVDKDKYEVGQLLYEDNIWFKSKDIKYKIIPN